MIISTNNIFLNTHNVSVAIFIINSTLKCTKENMLKNQTNNKDIFVYFFIYKPLFNRIGGVIVSMLASNAVDRGFEPDRVKPKTIKLVFVASPLSTQH